MYDADLQGYFDTIPHDQLLKCVRMRVVDRSVLALIQSWLQASVVERDDAGRPQTTRPKQGTPQGGEMTPLLANIYLHYVLDVWFHQEVLPQLAGRASLIRYADDFVLVFTGEDDARRVQQVLPQRFANHGLALHPEKTRLIRFVRPSDRSPNEPPPDTFDLLGFTHFWGRSRNGYWVVKRKTAKSRLHRAIQAVTHWCRKHLHDPVADQYQTLCRKLRGHYAYYGITGNSWTLSSFHEFVQRA